MITITCKSNMKTNSLLHKDFWNLKNR
jgi:hypothetical protein